MKRKIVTISREFGSGGKELGRLLSSILGIRYLDNEILDAVAKETQLHPSYIQHVMENGVIGGYPTLSNSFSSITHTTNTVMLIAKQQNIIKELAQNDDYIIIGRGADAILSNLKPFKIFVYADMQSKIERCKNRLKKDEYLTEKEI